MLYRFVFYYIKSMWNNYLLFFKSVQFVLDELSNKLGLKDIYQHLEISEEVVGKSNY